MRKCNLIDNNNGAGEVVKTARKCIRLENKISYTFALFVINFTYDSFAH